MYKHLLTSVVLLLALFNFVYGVDYLKAKEIKECFVPNKTEPEPVNLQWVSSLERIHYSYMSNLDIYMVASCLTHRDPKNFTDDELTHEACVIYKLSPQGEMKGYGFNGKSMTVNIKMKSTLMEDYYYGCGGNDRIYGTCWATLTDNKSFFVTLCCSNGDEMSWCVGAATPTLPKETVDRIHKHVESMGFKKENFKQISYDKCDPKYLGNEKVE